MSNHKSSKTTLIVLLFLVLCIFVGYYFFFLDLKNKNEHISVMLNERAIFDDVKENALSVQKMIQDLSLDIDRVNNSIISKDSDVAFIENLENLALSNGLDIDIESLLFEDNKQISSTTMTVLKVKAKTTGQWIGTYKFLAGLESQPFKIKIINFNLARNITEDTKNEWQSLFEISVLKYK